jgi:DNA (cytosine-5)-methyltransferase 1
MLGHIDLKGHDAIKRVYDPDGVSPTLTTMGGGHREPKIAEEVRACLTPDREEKRQNGPRFKDNDEPAHTINTQDRHGVAYGSYPKYRIRKLTPRECFRLQGFPDAEFDKLTANGISNSQMYKMAGNAVTVNVIDAIGKRLLRYLN